jgi:hypothetical protein
VVPLELSWTNPLAGPTWHLWYGPFALLAGYVADRHRHEAPSVLLALAAAGFVVAFDLRDGPVPARAWAVALPAIPLGMLLSRESTKAWHVALAVVMGAFALGTAYVVAIPLVWLASRWKGPRLKLTATFGRSVYWVHMLVITVLAKFGLETPAAVLLVTFAAGGLLLLHSSTRRLV